LPQTDARFDQQLANSQEAFEQPVLNSAAGYEQQKDNRDVQLLNSWGAGSEQQVAAYSWGAGSEQQVAAYSWGAGPEQQVAANSWGAGPEQQVAANSWGSGSQQRLAKNSWARESQQRATENSQAEVSRQGAVANSPAEVSEQRSGNIPAPPNSRPGYELVETVEATQDLAEQLNSLCARFCGSGRRWLPGRPRSAARRRPANQRMVIRKESQKYQMH
jgi:hypothetical protein